MWKVMYKNLGETFQYGSYDNVTEAELWCVDLIEDGWHSWVEEPYSEEM